MVWALVARWVGAALAAVLRLVGAEIVSAGAREAREWAERRQRDRELRKSGRDEAVDQIQEQMDETQERMDEVARARRDGAARDRLRDGTF